MKAVLFTCLLSVWYYGPVSASICCFPEVYEANQIYMKATVSHGGLSVIKGNLRIHHDGINKMVSFDEDLVVGGNPAKIRVISDYHNNVKYVISNGHCTRKSAGTYRHGCVPDFAVKQSETFYGEEHSPYRVSLYDNSVGSADSILTISTSGCNLINDVTAVTNTGADYMESVTYSNMTLGIKDRSVFTIPAICSSGGTVG